LKFLKRGDDKQELRAVSSLDISKAPHINQFKEPEPEPEANMALSIR
jgi:hypothetical protein